jgi:signal transduction histidine kinase/DNA-binding response OmpR family regulator
VFVLKKVAGFICCFLLFVLNTNAQRYTGTVRNFGPSQGLSHPDVRAVALDQQGVIWVGTRNGLNRFDGKRFKPYFKTDGLKSNNIENLFADGNVLWCIHKSRTIEAIENITLFDVKTKDTVEFRKWCSTKNIKTANIDAVHGNQNEITFRVIVNDSTYWYLKKPNQPAIRFNLGADAELIGSNQDGTFWFHDWQKNRLIKCNAKSQVLREITTKFLKTWQGQFYVNMNFGEHEEWIWSYDSLYRITDKRLVQVKSDWGYLGVDSSGFSKSSEFVRKHPYLGHYWFSVGSFSNLVDTSGNVLFSHRDKRSYVNNRDIFIDNVILQPTSYGLNIYSLYPAKFQSFKDDVKGGYRGITKIGGDYIVCNNEIGVRVIANSLDKENAHLSYVGDAAYRYQEFVYTIGRQTINVINNEKQLVETMFVKHAHEVWGMLVKDSLMFYSTLGLIEFNLKSKERRVIKSSQFPELNSSTIYSIQPKGNDWYWLCTTKGLYTWNAKSGEFELILAGVEDCREFQHLYQDGNTLWLASGCKGLIEYNTTTGKYIVHDFAHNATNITHSVYPDKHNNLWLSTDFEIVRFNKKDDSYKTFNEHDGLVNNEFNRISHFQEPDGTLLFGGITGMVKFHPDSLAYVKANALNLKPQVIDVWLYKKGQNVISQVTQSFMQDGKITIAPQDRQLAFDLTTNNISFSDQVAFSYRFGGDSTWKELPTNRLEFNVLPFGEHEITVRAYISNKNATNNELSFSVTVLKPIYLRGWFIVLVIISLLLTTVFAVILRTNRLEKQRAELEKEVKRRTEKILEDKAIIEKQAEELKSLDNLKNRFFANISHELRNPLTLIVGPVESLLTQEKVTVPKMIRSQMNMTLKNAKNLQKRINEILALSKIDAGKLKLAFTPTNANRFFGRAILAHDSWAKSKSVSIDFKSFLNDDLNLELDTDNVEKVLNNLMSNAIKHSPQDSIIKAELHQTDERNFYLTVKDQGKGIEASENVKIFDRYYQSKEGEKAGGTGLGLALSKEIAQLMNGDLSVESTTETGAKFRFSFSAVPTQTATEDDAIGNDASYFEEVTEILDLGKSDANILVVDDNEEMRAYIKSILGDSFKIYEAENGKEALNILAKNEIDLVTSDLMMPVMDGIEFLGEHKSSDKAEIPVIMITARAEDADRLGALEIGVDDYLTKPFYARELRARVKNLLRYRRNKEVAQEEAVNNSEEELLVSETGNQLQKIIEHVKSRLDDNSFTVTDLADAVGYSERQLRRIIKKEKGVTPNALIRELRLLGARKLLELEQYSTVSEVMYACGFKSQGHFAKSYYERFGKKPSEYFE